MKKLLFIAISLLWTGYIFAQNQTYRIKKNESLEEIAEKFRVSPDAILGLNPDLSKNNLADKVIVIPARETDKKTPSATGVRFKEYKVKRKETLYSLAKKNGIKVEDIKAYNPYLYDKELGENDMIRIPIFENESKDFNASVQTSIFRNIVHVVMPKETKYGIAKKYNMSEEELDSLNPSIRQLKPQDLPVGQVLKVINQTLQTDAQPGQADDVEDAFTYYEVKPKETLYSLTREFGISEDSLTMFNPILKELGLQAGMELKIPQKEGALPEIGEFSTNKLDLISFLNNKSTKTVSVMLPFNLYKISDDKSENREVLKKDEILGMALDLYSGVQIAVDSIRNMGIPVNLNVYDTGGNSSRTAEILRQNDFKHSQFIFGPLLASNIKLVAQDLKRSKVAILSPLINEQLKGSDKIFQTRPSSELKEKLFMSYLDSLHSNKNLLVLSDSKNAGFVSRLQKRFPSTRRISQANPDYLQKSDITNYLSKDRSNWVIMATEDYGVISNAISTLNAVRTSYDIRVLTPDKNKVYDGEIPKEYLSNLKFTFPSTHKSDASIENDNFNKAYLKKYGITPNAYASRGFDITFDALLRSASAKDIFSSLSRFKGTTEYVENRFNYGQKTRNGYINNAIFLLQFDDDLDLKIIN